MQMDLVHRRELCLHSKAPHPFPFRAAALLSILALGHLAASLSASAQSADLAARFDREVLPILKSYCLGCHSTEKQKGDLDLERFKSATDVLKHAKVWQGVVEQIGLGEMPPKEKKQPTPVERENLLSWVHLALD